MPREWETFYFMIGSSAAGLIGLLFVVVTLSSQRNPALAEAGSRIFLTPTMFHFGVVLLIGATAAMPEVSIWTMALVVATVAAVGLVYAGIALRRMIRGVVQVPHWSDYVFYGVLPTIVYLGLISSGVALWYQAPFAPHAIAVGALALLFLGIRDAWDLATYLAYHPPK